MSAHWCIWDDCSSDAIYCEAHAREYMGPEVDRLRADLAAARAEVEALRADALATALAWARNEIGEVELHQALSRLAGQEREGEK